MSAAATRSPPTVRVIRLPSVRMSWGVESTRFTTTRVRPPASTALMLRTMPTPTGMFLFSSPLCVSARSRAMRAGLSVVKLNGSPAGEAVVTTICTLLPARAEKLMSWRTFAAQAPSGVSKRLRPISNPSAPCTGRLGSLAQLVG